MRFREEDDCESDYFVTRYFCSGVLLEDSKMASSFTRIQRLQQKLGSLGQPWEKTVTSPNRLDVDEARNNDLLQISVLETVGSDLIFEA